MGRCISRRHFTRNALFRSASRALLETPPRSGSAPPAGRPGLSCWTDDCDTIEPGFPVRQRDGHTTRRESSACFSITRPAATRNSSADRSRSSPTDRARYAATGFSPGRPGHEARGPGRREGDRNDRHRRSSLGPQYHGEPCRQGSLRGPTPARQKGRRGNDPGLEKPRKCPREDLNLHPVTWTRT